MNAPVTKVAIVTGGARDIGRAVSIKLAAAGFKVCFNYLSSTEQANETLELIKAAGGDAIAVQGDMTQSADVQKLITTAVATYGTQIDYVVNVAGGILGRKPLADLDEAFGML